MARAVRPPAAIPLLEEAVHLLRSAGGGALGCYYLGTCPFVLAFLAFFGELSRGAYGWRHAALGSLGLAVLFVWMKYWQMRFLRALHAARTGAAPGPPGAAATWRAVIQQAALQPTGLILIPFSMLMLLPFAWVYAFYQNLSLYGDGRHATLAALLRQAQREALRWPMQNHILLAVLHIFAFFVLLNLLLFFLLLPQLSVILFGLETVFSRSGLALLNTTFLTIVCFVTYLCVDPLFKATFMLRCFYGESVTSGADLQTALRRIVTAGALLFALGAAAPAPALAAPAPVAAPPAGATAVTPAALDAALRDVLASPEYSWKLPRVAQPPAAQELTWFEKFVEDLFRLTRDTLKGFSKMVGDFFKWLRDHMPRFKSPQLPDAPRPELSALQIFSYTAFAILGVGLLVTAFFAFRAYRRHRLRQAMVAAPAPAAAVPDLTAEHVAADALPVERWLELARELAAKGEYRLALRAAYLAQLAQLARRRLLTIKLAKSNRDYWHELRRRAHALPELPAVFVATLADFERVWYGDHPADDALFTRFTAAQRIFWSDAA